MNRDFVQRGGLWVIGQFAIMIAVAVLAVAFRAHAMRLYSSVCGFVLLAISAVCGIAGAAAMGRTLTPFPKPAPRSRLIQSGIYGLMRHPLYTAVICAAAGWSMIWASWPAIAASAVLALFLDAKARREERWLRDQFLDYAAYTRRVKRFIPGIY